MLAIPRVQASASALNIPVPRVVVIFVPGIMGTRLKLGPDSRDWDPDDSFNMGDWATDLASQIAAKLGLGNKSTLFTEAGGLSDPQKERGWGQISQRFYGEFLKGIQIGLDNSPIPMDAEVWAAGYDWRNANTASAKNVLARIKDIQAQRNPDRTILITHSMGGLVTRHITSRRKGAKLIEAVIHIGQPVTGAVVGYRRLLGGTVRSVDGTDLRLLLGGAPEKFATIISGFPSFCELLPTDEYRHSPNPADFWLREKSDKTEFIVTPGPDETIYDLYQKARWPPSAVSTKLDDEVQETLRKRIKSAQKAHEKIAGDPATGTPPKCHIATWSLLSTNQETDVTVLAEHRGETKRPKVHLAEGREEAGDGTVPAASASALFPGEGGPLNHTPDPLLSRQFFVDGLVHDVMCEDADLQLGLLQLLFGILAPRSLAPGSGPRITFDENLIWAKLFHATGGGRGAAEAAAELRVAKFFAEQGRQVHLLKERTVGLTPDMHVDGIGAVEVKRLLKVDTDDGRKTIRHAMDQVASFAPGGGQGLVVVVHSEDAKLEFVDYHDVVHDMIRTEFRGVARGILDSVVREDRLPPIIQGNP